MTKEMSKDEQIGFHKGSVAVLSKEREEMIKIAQICEQLIQMHLKALGDLGVDLKELENQEKKVDSTPKKKVPIEHLI